MIRNFQAVSGYNFQNVTHKQRRNTSGAVLQNYSMEIGKGAWIPFIIAFVITFFEVDAHKFFFNDFLKHFNSENPVFISTDELDPDLSLLNENSLPALIQYSANKDEDQVADHIQTLHLLGDLKMVVFVDKGHHKLLKKLMNDLKLFHNGPTGLVSEIDVVDDTNLALRLDTALYLYNLEGKSIILKEVYAVNKRKKIETVGLWRESQGLEIPIASMWERRKNMDGMQLRVATLPFPPFQDVHYDKSGETIIGGSGLFLDPLNILARRLNFTLKFITSNDGQWGALTKNGTWNGLIGMVIKNQIDVAAGGMSVTRDRIRVVSFSRAIMEEEVTLTAGQTIEPEANPWIYVAIFPDIAWFICFVMVMSISIYFVIVNYSGLNYMHGKFDSEPFTIINGLGLALTFFRQIYYDFNISCKSTKIMFFLSAVSTYLLYIHYTAYLTASSTYREKTEIKSFGDVLSKGYQVSVWNNTAYQDLMRYSKTGTAMNDVYHKTMVNRFGAFLPSYNDVPKLFATKKTLLFGGKVELKSLFTDLTFFSIQGLIDKNCYEYHLLSEAPG